AQTVPADRAQPLQRRLHHGGDVTLVAGNAVRLDHRLQERLGGFHRGAPWSERRTVSARPAEACDGVLRPAPDPARAGRAVRMTCPPPGPPWGAGWSASCREWC